MTNNKNLKKRLEGVGFIGKKLDKIWPTVLELQRSGLTEDSIVRHIFEEFGYLL